MGHLFFICINPMKLHLYNIVYASLAFYRYILIKNLPLMFNFKKMYLCILNNFLII